MRLRFAPFLLTAFCMPLCGGAETPATGEPAAPARPLEITPATQKAIRKGLDWLARTQSSDGGWGDSGNNDVALTAMAGLAFLANGSTPNRGPYADNVSRAISFLLSRSDPTTGLIATTNGSLMHCHGYAMLFLGEVYGMEALPDHRERIRTVLQRAVKFSAASQTAAGGWYYDASTTTDDEGSTTITQIEGLRACRNVGLIVPIRTINRALEYLRKSQNPDGSIRYKVSNPGQGSAALTAAGLMCFYSLGDYSSDNAKRALKFLNQKAPNGSLERTGHFYYSHFYAAQAFYLAGEPYWGNYWRAASKMFLQTQSQDGMWVGDIAPPFDTAVACIILQIPYRYLPILQK